MSGWVNERVGECLSEYFSFFLSIFFSMIPTELSKHRFSNCSKKTLVSYTKTSVTSHTQQHSNLSIFFLPSLSLPPSLLPSLPLTLPPSLSLSFHYTFPVRLVFTPTASFFTAPSAIPSLIILVLFYSKHTMVHSLKHVSYKRVKTCCTF